MADVESLSNEELRVELLKYGFANIPVTSTTRKVLVKKLKNHLETEKSKTRRDTFHVTKYSSGEDDDGLAVEVVKKKTTSRRATMAAPEVTVKRNETNGRASPARKSVGRSATQVVVEEAPRKNVRKTPQKNTMEFDSVEETDEEVHLISDNRRRKSKSPSLTKSKVVTTSYKNKTETIVEPEVDEPLYVPEDDDEDDNEPLTQRFPKTRKASPARPDVKKRQTFTSPLLEPTYASPKFTRPSLTASYNYSSPILTSNRRTTLASTSIAPVDESLNDSFEGDYTSPYLSDFTRRLSRLKAEPLSQKKPVVALPRTKDVYYRTGSSSASRQPTQAPDTLKGSLREVFRSLSSYKKFFLLICFLVLVIFFLVMFYF